MSVKSVCPTCSWPGSCGPSTGMASAPPPSPDFAAATSSGTGFSPQRRRDTCQRGCDAPGCRGRSEPGLLCCGCAALHSFRRGNSTPLLRGLLRLLAV